MADKEPSLLREPDASSEPKPIEPADTVPTRAPSEPKKQSTEPGYAKAEPVRASSKPGELRRPAQVVHVVGFWKRLVAAAVDLAVVIPTAMLITFLVSKISGVKLPSSNLHLLDIDLWIDLVLATDPAIVMGIVLFGAVALTYLFVFHIVQGRTLGMRLLRMRVIDVYGDRPSPARCAARVGGYVASVLTLFLGFLWMGFDSEKRGLQDWLAGTLVVRAER